MWKIGNKKLQQIQLKAWNRFLRFKATTKFDELNVINNSKTLYKELDNFNRQALLRLAQECYVDVVKETFDKDADSKDIPTSAFVLGMLKGYNGITKYVYTHEVDRKRARFAESLIANQGISNKELQRAYNAWVHQSEQYVIDVEKQATLKAYKDNGIKKVRWITQRDGRVCQACAELDGKVFDIDNVPEQLHDNCRCEIEEIKEESDDDRN